MTNDDFTANLKFLCGHYKSVADVCRRLKINRQQFNKYLGGQSAPSHYNLRKICEFFGVDEGEILASHDAFLLIFNKASPAFVANMIPGELTKSFFPETPTELRKYLGYYHAYVVTPSRQGYILKSITRLFEEDGAVKTKTFENISVVSEKHSSSSINKYRGFCFLSSQILYLIEHEHMNNRGFIYTALYPSFRSPVDLLNGLVLGISGGSFRMPYSSQIVLEYLGEAPDLRAAISGCGYLPNDTELISDSIKSLLLIPTSPTDYNISAPVF